MEMNQDEDIIKTLKRISTVLYLICIFMITAIYLLNRNLIEDHKIYKDNYASFQTSVDNLGRLRAYHLLNTDFFIGMISFKLKRLIFYHDNPTLSKIGESFHNRWIYYRIDGSIGEEEGEVDSTLYNEITSYSKKVSKVFAEYKKPEIRLKLINKAMRDSFSNIDLQKFMQDKVLPEIIKIDSDNEWKPVLSWILFPEHSFLATGIIESYTPDKSEIAYEKRNSQQNWIKRKDRLHLYETLCDIKNYEDAEAILISKWHESYELLKHTPNALPTVSLQALGFSAKMDDILMISGLLIIFIQIYFFILWEKINKENSQNVFNATFAFPYFSCRSDPLRKGTQNGLTGNFQRLIWASFLIFPSIIISIGILIRFDFYGLISNHGKLFGSIHLSFLHVLLYYRSKDPFSVLLDCVNMVCLLISLLILIKITNTNEDRRSTVNIIKPQKKFKRIKMVLYYSPLIILLLLAFRYFTVFSNKEWKYFSNISTSIIIFLFAMLWMILSCVSNQRQLRLLQVLSSIMNMILIVLLLF